MSRIRPEDPAELLDALSSSRLASALKPVTALLSRNTALTLHAEHVRMLSLAFKYTSSEGVAGDYAEFGVWTGRNLIEAWRIASKYEVARRLFAFDSFEGLPELGEPDRAGPFTSGEFAHSREAFDARLRRARVPRGAVSVVQGRFDETLGQPEQIEPREIAIAWIDCDLYESTVPVLDFIKPRLSLGSVLLFDDWYTFRASPEKGEMRACREWLDRNSSLKLVQWRAFHFAGQAFIVQSL